MRKWQYFTVQYQGKLRFETISKDEAENYARSLWARDEYMGAEPTIEAIDRSEK